MRLACPNCGAQYEVPDEVIPTAGRDVQCSNCGHTWFQSHPDSEGFAPSDDIDDGLADTDFDAPDEDVAPETEPDQRRGLSSDVKDILREEADHETKLRAAEAQADPIESQPDLGLDAVQESPDTRARETAERMARMRGDLGPEPDIAQTDLDPGARRDLLPDIEDINSSLDDNERKRVQKAMITPSAPAADVAGVEDSGHGFRRGFALGLLLIVILMLLYVQAREISEAVPQADPYLNSYVNGVDNARIWLDQQLSRLFTASE